MPDTVLSIIPVLIIHLYNQELIKYYFLVKGTRTPWRNDILYLGQKNVQNETIHLSQKVKNLSKTNRIKIHKNHS